MLELELQRLDGLEELIRTMDAKLDQLAQGDARTVLVKSIPGVGWRTAEAIVTSLDNPHRFTSRRQVAAYAGLTPRRYQSGRMDRQGRISKQGRRSLRQALNQAAWSAIRRNAPFRAFYLRLGGAQKARRKQALVAVMRKLLVLAWALLRDGRSYQARGTPRSAAAA
jgi:transposase